MLELVNSFNKFNKYPKAKRGQFYEEKVKEFSKNSETLFDIFRYDDKKRHEIEESFKLKIIESEYKFFEDQENRGLSKCVKVIEQLTASETRFQQRCNSKVQFDRPSTSTVTDNISLSGGRDWKCQVVCDVANFMNHLLKSKNWIQLKIEGNILFDSVLRQTQHI